jgi:hypothetical protein
LYTCYLRTRPTTWCSENPKKETRHVLLAALYCKFLWKFGGEILPQGISHTTTQMNSFLCNFAKVVWYAIFLSLENSEFWVALE